MKFCLLQFSQIMFNQFQIVSMHIYLYILLHPIKLIDKCNSEIHVIATIEQIQGVLSSKYSRKVSRISLCVFLECSGGQHHFQYFEGYLEGIILGPLFFWTLNCAGPNTDLHFILTMIFFNQNY